MPALLVVWPEALVVWPAIELIDCCMGQGLGIKIAASRTAHISEYFPVPPSSVSPLHIEPPQGGHPVSPGDLPSRPAGRSGPDSCEVTAFPPGSQCA